MTNSQSVTGKIISNIKDYYTYEDSDQLGKGHFGKVYRATNVQHGYVVALKIVSKKAVKGNRLASLQNEINIMMIMKHDNIVRLYEALEDAQNVYFAVEICTGGELFPIFGTFRISLHTITSDTTFMFVNHYIQNLSFCRI